jgi:hypothetical protein
MSKSKRALELQGDVERIADRRQGGYALAALLGVLSFVLLRPVTAEALPQYGVAQKLIGTVGPGATISLRTPAGARAQQLKAGTYVITIRDRSATHNFHLRGPGTVEKRTKVGFVGTVTWRLGLAAGSYRFQCDSHAESQRGTFRVI